MILNQIIPNSPAATTQFKIGDILIKIGNLRSAMIAALEMLFSFSPSEQNVTVIVERNDERLEFPMKTGIRTFENPNEPEARQRAARQAAIPGQAILDNKNSQSTSKSNTEEENTPETNSEDAPE